MLDKTFERQHGVVARRQAMACVMTADAISYRTRADGPWQIVLPGVYLRGRGSLAAKQRAVAAFLYAGAAMAVTGPAALAFQYVPGYDGDLVDILVPLANQRASAGFARLRRTSVEPGASWQDGVVRYAPLDRAVADTARMLTDIGAVRAVVATAVPRHQVELWQLSRELDAGPRRHAALLRRALAEVGAGVRSTAEADLLALVRRAKLPEPLYNPRLYVGTVFLASPDAWWPEAGVAVEVDSRAWHLSPADWERTLERHARMTAQGILVLHFPPARLRSARRDVTAEIRSALARSPGPLPQVRTVPCRQIAGVSG